MSLTHCIRTLIDLKDKNISFPENYCEERVIKGRRTKLIYATLTYKPACCKRCGCLNTQFSIVKDGFLTSKIKMEITKNYFISNRVKQSVAFELEDNSSRKNIAKRHFI